MPFPENTRLLQLAREDPEQGELFADFLFAHRPHQQENRTVTEADFEQSLEYCLQYGGNAVERFWNQFCNEQEREIVRSLLGNVAPKDHTNPRRLVEYGFIVTTEDKPHLRVPFFTLWLRRYLD